MKIQLSNVQTLIEQAQFLPAILFLCSILEATLRKRVIEENLPIENFSPINLLNHTFSSGEISLSQFDLFKEFLSLRNKTAHGVIMSADSTNVEILQSANDFVNSLVERWSLKNK